jgi:hypothetical protein
MERPAALTLGMLRRMPDPERVPPDDVLELARQREEARARRDWDEADELRARIEAAGWRPVDAGTRTTLEPARLPDAVVAGDVLYGSPSTVPSRLHEPDAADLTVLAAVAGEDDARAWARLAAGLPEGIQLVIVANAPSAGLVSALRSASAAVEHVGSSAVLSPGGVMAMGLRRAVGRVVAWLPVGFGTGAPAGGAALVAGVTALAGPLDDDARLAVTGTRGLRSRDLRHFDPAPPGEVEALGAGALAFRRRDAIDRGPLDERFALAEWLSVWWSLVLRDEGSGRPARRALAVAAWADADRAAANAADDSGSDAPAEREADGPDEAERLVRRDRYRLLKRFARRRDLLLGGT